MKLNKVLLLNEGDLFAILKKHIEEKFPDDCVCNFNITVKGGSTDGFAASEVKEVAVQLAYQEVK